MKVVVDTNVVAYALLGTPRFADEALELLGRVKEILAPALWEAELANVIWMAVRNGVITRDVAPSKLGTASRLGIISVDIRSLWHGALLRSIHSGISVYDSLFVELADRECVPLASFDRKLAAAFPAQVRDPLHV